MLVSVYVVLNAGANEGQIEQVRHMEKEETDDTRDVRQVMTTYASLQSCRFRQETSVM